MKGVHCTAYIIATAINFNEFMSATNLLNEYSFLDGKVIISLVIKKQIRAFCMSVFVNSILDYGLTFGKSN